MWQDGKRNREVLEMSGHKHGDISRTRTQAQEAAYQQTIGKNVCPFCGPTEHMPREIRKRMLLTGKWWRAWDNPFPYPGHERHIILAPIEHWTEPSDLPAGAIQEWMEFNTRLIREFKLPGGGLVMRFGSNEYKGGSITHLHSHIQVPNRQGFAIATFYADDALQAFFKANNPA